VSTQQARFRWLTFDVNDLLPAGWQEDVLATAGAADVRRFPRTPVLTRESPDVRDVPRGRVHADVVRDQLDWLPKLYKGEFLELATEAAVPLFTGQRKELVSPAWDDRYGVVLNVQRGTEMRFECHVDSNPLTGLLFCTDHASGGELVVARDHGAEGVAAVDQDCSVIRPHAGHLIFFDARRYPHYARVLTADSDTRIVAVMNYYTESYPETTRPRELNEHLYGDNRDRELVAAEV
jgi:hypothetical protein